MFHHVTRFDVRLAGAGNVEDRKRTVVAFVSDHMIGATHGGELTVLARTPFGAQGRWSYAEALAGKVPALGDARLDPAAVLAGNRMLFLLSGYQEGEPPFLAIPVLFNPHAWPVFVPLTKRWGRPFPLGRVTARRLHDLPDGNLALTTETRVSHMFHVESDDTVDGVCCLDLARGSVEELKRLPRHARPHDSGAFHACGFGITVDDETLFGPPAWGSDADVQVAEGYITVIPADQGKPRPELTLRGPCANALLDSKSASRRVRAGRRGRTLLVIDGTPEDRVVVDVWELPS
jgi:hypothetical protein